MPAAYQAADLQRIFQAINDRIRALEDQIERVSAAAGVAYARLGADVPCVGRAARLPSGSEAGHAIPRPRWRHDGRAGVAGSAGAAAAVGEGLAEA
jgi:hypothetical protein